VLATLIAKSPLLKSDPEGAVVLLFYLDRERQRLLFAWPPSEQKFSESPCAPNAAYPAHFLAKSSYPPFSREFPDARGTLILCCIKHLWNNYQV
jgi:hypothetical protein